MITEIALVYVLRGSVEKQKDKKIINDIPKYTQSKNLFNQKDDFEPLLLHLLTSLLDLKLLNTM